MTQTRTAKKTANATRVRDVMTPDPVTLPSTASIQDAAAMRDCGIGDVPVVDGGGLVGIVTDRDIVVHGPTGDYERATVQDIASGEPV